MSHVKSLFKSRRFWTVVCSCYLAALLIVCGSVGLYESGYASELHGSSASTALVGEDVLSSILAVFTAVGEWISTNVPKFFTMFYSTTDGLTFLGVLAVAGLSFSVVFLSYIGLCSSDAALNPL